MSYSKNYENSNYHINSDHDSKKYQHFDNRNYSEDTDCKVKLYLFDNRILVLIRHKMQFQE